MSDAFTFVGTFLAGGCCVMVCSAIVIVVLAIRSRPNRTGSEPAPSNPATSGLPRLHLVAEDDTAPTSYEELWRDPDVRVRGDVPPRYDGMR
jgi:hypothetical protein